MFRGNQHVHAKTTFRTEHATRHLAALCQHFSKKVTATFSGATGHVAFPFGACELTADETHLMLKASASEADQLDMVIDVVTRHLERFAFRENPILDWDILSQTSFEEKPT